MPVVKPQPESLSTIITDIEKGDVKIPRFQREFVWDLKKSAALLDSILKGYPIGTFILWRTDEQFRSIRNLGRVKLPEQRTGEKVSIVLDGQQRLTSLFAAVKGIIIERANGKKDDFSQIYLNIEASGDEPIVLSGKAPPEKVIISFKELYENTNLDKFSKLSNEHKKKYQDLRDRLITYQFNCTHLTEASINVATEVFTRLNTGGVKLSVFEIMSAKVYDAGLEFDLLEKIESLQKSVSKSEFSEILFKDEVPTSLPLQVASALIQRDIKQSTILSISKTEFINIWPAVEDGIKHSIDFLRKLGIPNSKLLPFPAIIILLSYLFHNKGKKRVEEGETFERLRDLFWRISLGNRYNSNTNARIIADLQKIDDVLNNKLPKYEWDIKYKPNDLLDDKLGKFKTSSSYTKAILCIYANNNPKSFENGAEVIIDSNYLKQANSKNYHHFFPKAFLQKNPSKSGGIDSNHILNITIVDDHMNKNVIRDKAPATYMKTFQKNNRKLTNTMKSHLIGDLEKFGILTNDYPKFLQERAKLVSKEIEKLIIDQGTSGKDHFNEPESETEE